ncbi:MAG TPA: hypothetical protein VHE83_16945 [Mycobacteriales bacterium]|nr:hypothetical protein [Mycobacteriales bacterium]
MDFEAMDGLPSNAPFLSGVDIGLWLRLIVAFVATVSAGVGVAVGLS